MVFKNLCILVLRTKVASASDGLNAKNSLITSSLKKYSFSCIIQMLGKLKACFKDPTWAYYA